MQLLLMAVVILMMLVSVMVEKNKTSSRDTTGTVLNLPKSGDREAFLSPISGEELERALEVLRKQEDVTPEGYEFYDAGQMYEDILMGTGALYDECPGKDRTNGSCE